MTRYLHQELRNQINRKSPKKDGLNIVVSYESGISVVSCRQLRHSSFAPSERFAKILIFGAFTVDLILPSNCAHKIGRRQLSCFGFRFRNSRALMAFLAWCSRPSVSCQKAYRWRRVFPVRPAKCSTAGTVRRSAPGRDGDHRVQPGAAGWACAISAARRSNGSRKANWR
jgi:hypothetical protein